MRSVIFSTALVGSAVFGGCGGSHLDQGSGTSGLFPFKKGNGYQVERAETKINPVPVDLQEVMTRWNIVADGRTVQAHGIEFNFLWNEQDLFPHPTFKGGSQEAYETFAKIFIDFFADADNLDYVKTNRLQRVELIAVVGDNVGIRTSFYKLVDDFSTDDVVSEDSREKIKKIGHVLPPYISMKELR